MVGEIFSVQAYHHLLTVVSSMITRKLNPRVYDSLLVLLAAVHLYRVYRRLDTLPLYLYYELLVCISIINNKITNHFIKLIVPIHQLKCC